MDTKRLMYFCTIVEQGQISRAARLLNMSQPPLSQRLKELEDELGVQLIQREGHAWQVTESGRVLYERARTVLDDLGEIAAEVKNAADGFSGKVSIGASTTCLSTILDLAPSLSFRFPKLKWRLHVSDSTDLEHHIQNRDLDFALVLLPTRENSFAVTLLKQDSFAVVFPPGYHPASDPKVTLHDLLDLPLLLLRRWEGGGSFECLTRAFQEKGLSPNIYLNSPDSRVLLDCLERGMVAAAIVPSREIPERIRAGFAIRTLDLPGMAVQPALIHLKDRYLSCAVRAVIAEIQAASAGAGACL